MRNIKKRELLNNCDKKTLRRLADKFDLPVRSNAGIDTLHYSIMDKRAIRIEDDILPMIMASELKEACHALGHGSAGNKTELIKRITPEITKKSKIKVAGKSLIARKTNTALTSRSISASTPTLTPMKNEILTLSQLEQYLSKAAWEESLKAEANFKSVLSKFIG